MVFKVAIVVGVTIGLVSYFGFRKIIADQHYR